MVVHENLAIYSHNPEVRYIEFLLMDSGSELSPEQDPVVWKILNFGHFALNSANWTLNSVFPKTVSFWAREPTFSSKVSQLLG